MGKAFQPPAGPDFLCIGAMKGGTTWLYSQLNHHDDFLMPPIKELHYFDRAPTYPSATFYNKSLLSRLLDLKAAHKKWLKVRREKRANPTKSEWLRRYYFSNYSDAWYCSLFHQASKQGKLSGDITPSYSILSDEDVAHMRSVVGDIPVVFLLRNPIDRAWSMYRHSLKFQGSSFTPTTESMLEFMDTKSQTLRSDYLRTIEVFGNHFPHNKILIGFYDAIKDQPKEFLGRILSHLGSAMEGSASEHLKRTVNVSPTLERPKEVTAHLVEKYTSDIKALSQQFGSYASHWQAKLSETELPAATPQPTLTLEEARATPTTS